MEHPNILWGKKNEIVHKPKCRALLEGVPYIHHVFTEVDSFFYNFPTLILWTMLRFQFSQVDLLSLSGFRTELR